MSDVVATILLLALTVTLFSAIFAFVTSFPPPPAQNTQQFQANLVLTSNGTWITGVNITHLAGAPVPSNALIYFKSSRNPGRCPFIAPASVSQGIGSSVWSLGQTWSLPFNTFCKTSSWDPVPDNITVYVVSQANLIFSVVLPGQQLITSPAVTSTWVSPNPVAVARSFTVYATITGAVNPASVYVNLASLGIPGLSTPQPMTLSEGQWTYAVSSGAPKAGSYTGLINLTGAAGQTNVATVTISVTSSGSSFFVSVAANPTSGTAPLTVTFVTSQNGGTPPFNYSWSFGDGSGAYTMNPTHTYSTVGTYLAGLVVTDKNGNISSASVSITVNPSTPTCSGETVAANRGQTYSCSLNPSQYMVFTFTVSQTQWNNYNYVNLYEVDSTTSGSQPVFRMGTGLGGTPSYSSASLQGSGPNAYIPIPLSSPNANVFGGWGTYWVVIQTGAGDTGGFCFEWTLSGSQQPNGGPTCSAPFIGVRGSGGSVSSSVSSKVPFASTIGAAALPPAGPSWTPSPVLQAPRSVEHGRQIPYFPPRLESRAA